MTETTNIYEAIAEGLSEYQPLEPKTYHKKGYYKPFKNLLNNVSIDALSLIGFTRTGLLKFYKKFSNGKEKTFVSDWKSLSQAEQKVALATANSNSILHDYAKI